MHRTLLLSLFLLTAGLTAGCIGDTASPAEPASSSDPAPDDTDSGSSWNLTITATAEYVLAAGRPFGPREQIAVVAGCAHYQFEMPAGTTEATFNVAGPAVNESRPGAGYQSFKVKHDDHDRYMVPPENDRPREERTIQVEDPRNGTWFLWVWPWGPAVNQVYDIEITLDGTGPAPTEEPSLADAGFCAEAGGAFSAPIERP